ncbi:hypothetical protein [Rhizosaccharibacter radicis]|uniref:DUF3108 domain-containing protein n=1 Tax=Rhizosaccharibacter radicis TaxID=2782605 RepID=A0ABT1VWM2_9PROT|nr:DUF3108 domain-containing protein [Acetobacteraceae bacterium KSS12]
MPHAIERPNRPGWRTSLLGLFLLAALSPPLAGARAQDAAPAAAGAAPYAPGQAIRLTLEAYSHGFHAMSIVADLRLADGGYSAQLSNHTAGMLSLFSRSNITSDAVGRFSGDDVIPLSFSSGGWSRGAQRSVKLSFKDGQPHVDELTPPDTRRDPVTPEQARGGVDSLSGMVMLIHEIATSHRCDGHAKLFDGLRLSTLSVRTVGEQPVPVDHRSPYGGSGLRCDFVGTQIGGFLHNEDEEKMHRPQTGSAWFEPVLPGAPALPVRVVFEHPKLGEITVLLTGVSTGS